MEREREKKTQRKLNQDSTHNRKGGRVTETKRQRREREMGRGGEELVLRCWLKRFRRRSLRKMSVGMVSWDHITSAGLNGHRDGVTMVNHR